MLMGKPKYAIEAWSRYQDVAGVNGSPLVLDFDVQEINYVAVLEIEAVLNKVLEDLGQSLAGQEIVIALPEATFVHNYFIQVVIEFRKKLLAQCPNCRITITGSSVLLNLMTMSGFSDNVANV